MKEELQVADNLFDDAFCIDVTKIKGLVDKTTLELE